MSAFRPTVLTISLGTIEANFRVVQSPCADGVKQIAVVKADAYGHGMVSVARRLLAAGAWGVAVATVVWLYASNRRIQLKPMTAPDRASHRTFFVPMW